MAAELAADPRIAALSITDNAGGHALVSPTTLAEALVARGHDVIVHVACRDRNRNALQSLGWDLASRGLTNVLALSGDYPVEGYERPAGPCSTSTRWPCSSCIAALGVAGRLPPDGFFLGCAVNPTSASSATSSPSTSSSASRRAPAPTTSSPRSATTPASRTSCCAACGQGVAIPVIANVYILTHAVARIFNAGKVPGCVVTDELLAVVERPGQSRPTRAGRSSSSSPPSRSRSPAASATAGVYLGGHRDGRRRSSGSSSSRTASGRTTGATSPGRSSSASRASSTSSSATRRPGWHPTDREPSLPALLDHRPHGGARAAASPSPTASNRLVHDLVFTPGTRGLPARHRASTSERSGCTSRGRSTCSSRRSRSRSSTAATAATARCPTSPTSAPSRSARRTSATARAAARTTAICEVGRPRVHLGPGLHATQAVRRGADACSTARPS